MGVLATKLAPIIIIFGIGIILRKLKVFNQDDADLFLKLAFYVSLPASILLAIPKLKLNFDLMYLPIIAIAIIFITYFVSRIVGHFYKLPRPALGTFLVSTMIMNTSFTLPFLIAAYGQNGLALATLFDFGNALLIFTFIYFTAIKYGGEKKSSSEVFQRLLKTPTLWSLIISLGLNLGQIQLPLVIDETLTVLTSTLGPLLMLSVGISFSPSITNAKVTLTTIGFRMLFGLLLGLIFVNLFALEGLNRIVVLVSSAAPVGFSALTFSSLEGLDKQLAASSLSLSVFIGMFSTTVLLLFL